MPFILSLKNDSTGASISVGLTDAQIAALVATQPPATTTPPPATTPPPVTSPAPSAIAPTGVPGNWKLIFADEFDKPALDTSKWVPGWFAASGLTPAVNADICVNVFDSAQVSILNGELHITAVAKPATLGGKNYPVRSGIVSSNGKFSFVHGCFEARMWLPAGSGLWPAWWADGQNWPADGEIDVLESSGADNSTAVHYHYPGGGPGKTVPVPGSTAGWHTYAADWEPGVITFYYDGKVVWTVKDGDVIGGAKVTITSSPLYLILNLQVQSVNAPLPATMRVQYVRVWSRA